MNSRIALMIAVLGISLTACSAIGARPSGSTGPSPASPSPNPSATDPATTPPATQAPDSPQPSGTAKAKLDGREFVSVLVTENGKSKQLVPGTAIRLGFSDGSISAYAGCNHMSGDYNVADGTLVIGQMATTEIGCPANLAGQDQWLADFLASRPAISVVDNALKEMSLENATTRIDFQDREVAEPDQPLTGITWNLSSILDGETASSVPTGAAATLLFNDDGTVQIYFGCNSGGGNFAVEGDKLTFDQIVSTKMACQGDKGDVESAVTAVLHADDITWSIDHSTLTLQTPDGHGLQYAAALDTSAY